MLICRKPFRVTVTPGFLLLLGVLFYLDDGSAMIFWAILAAFVHEMGHVIAALFLKGIVRSLTLGFAGAELQLDYPRTLSYGQENMVALAGPAVNLMMALPLLRLQLYMPGVICLGLGVCNLLPVLPLDGGRILLNILTVHFGPDGGERLSRWTAGVVIGIMAGFGVVSLIHYANGILLAGSVWLLIGMLRNRAVFSEK